MSSPQLFLDFRVSEKQPAGAVSLEDLDRIRESKLRFCLEKDMDMIRHHFHHIYSNTQLLRSCLQARTDLVGDISDQNRFSILGTPNQMILKRVQP